MKFLHLSDLHIGKTVNHYSMIAEQQNVFAQVIGYIREEKPAAVVIAGDVYDRAVPGVEAVSLFDDFLTCLAGEGVAVIAVSGNHDSPERMDFASRLLCDKNLFLCGSFNGELKKITMNDEHGEINFWLLPFVKPLSVRSFFPSANIESYSDAVNAVIESAKPDYTVRNVLVSHQYYTKAGITPVRCESELSPVGGLDAVDSGIIEKFDYVALGHLHGAQSVGSERLRYAGSPVKYSFSECRQEKSVSLVTISEKGNLKITALPLKPIHDMREIKGELAKLTGREVASLADREDFLHVILTDEEEITDPMGKLRSVYPNIMSLDFDNRRSNIDTGTIAPDSEKTEKLSPYDLFREFFLETQGSTMSGAQAEIVTELLETQGDL